MLKMFVIECKMYMYQSLFNITYLQKYVYSLLSWTEALYRKQFVHHLPLYSDRCAHTFGIFLRNAQDILYLLLDMHRLLY